MSSVDQDLAERSVDFTIDDRERPLIFRTVTTEEEVYDHNMTEHGVLTQCPQSSQSSWTRFKEFVVPSALVPHPIDINVSTGMDVPCRLCNQSAHSCTEVR